VATLRRPGRRAVVVATKVSTVLCCTADSDSGARPASALPRILLGPLEELVLLEVAQGQRQASLRGRQVPQGLDCPFDPAVVRRRLGPMAFLRCPPSIRIACMAWAGFHARSVPAMACRARLRVHSSCSPSAPGYPRHVLAVLGCVAIFLWAHRVITVPC